MCSGDCISVHYGNLDMSIGVYMVYIGACVMEETLMGELEKMIPDLIGFFADDLEKKYDVQKMIAEKMTAFDPASLERIFYQQAGKPILQLKIFVAILGLLLGGAELLLLRMI